MSGTILPSQEIARLIAEDIITIAEPVVEGQIQPASLDLRLGKVAYRVRASFLPGEGTTVRSKLDRFALHQFRLGDGAVLETGCVYLVPLLESVALGAELSAITNPKSSTGRLDVFTRVITDGGVSFDQVPAGYSGPLYAEICPQTFPVLVRTGSRLSQIRFRRYGDVQSRVEELTVDLTGRDDGPIGYRAKRHTGVVDVDRPGAYPVEDFWEPIHARDRSLILDPDQFYILASKEAVNVPATHAAEMLPFNAVVGEFRVHYAGFFDPGFGDAAAGGAGARAVLEVRSHNVPFILEDGQKVGQLVYEPLSEIPETLYGGGIGSHYQAQGLKLSKHFK